MTNQIAEVEGIPSSQVECAAGVLAGDRITATLGFESGATLRFEKLGYHAFGANAVNIIVTEAGGLVPRVASCSGIAPPNFHRESVLGHHFAPTLIDVKEALSRHREVLEEVQYWPQCPQSWDVQDKRGHNYRYCARRKGAQDEPPRPANCPG